MLKYILELMKLPTSAFCDEKEPRRLPISALAPRSSARLQMTRCSSPRSHFGPGRCLTVCYSFFASPATTQQRIGDPPQKSEKCESGMRSLSLSPFISRSLLDGCTSLKPHSTLSHHGPHLRVQGQATGRE